MDQKFYWSERWETKNTGWDTGSITTPFIHYFESLKNKDQRILIPGCGNGYEPEYLWNNGFRKLTIVDIAELPLQHFKSRNPEFPESQLVCADFFSFEGSFDLMIEQTFYCAIPPAMRDQYVQKVSQLLVKGGKIAGLLFNFPLTEDGPPFGGSEEEYRMRFSPFFDFLKLEPAADSIKPRAGRELWFEAVRK